MLLRYCCLSWSQTEANTDQRERAKKTPKLWRVVKESSDMINE